METGQLLPATSQLLTKNTSMYNCPFYNKSQQTVTSIFTRKENICREQGAQFDDWADDSFA